MKLSAFPLPLHYHSISTKMFELRPTLLPALEHTNDVRDSLGLDVASYGIVHLQLLVLLIQFPSNHISIDHLYNKILSTNT